MISVDAGLIKEAIIARAELINSVLIAGVLLSSTVWFLRYGKERDFELIGAKFPVKMFPLICVAYTVAHIYCTWLFYNICVAVRPNPDAWQALTWKGPLIFNGMLARQSTYEIFGISIEQIPTCDPTLWLFYLFCFGIYKGFSWSCEVAGFPLWRTRLFVFILLTVNWITGSVWGYAANSLLK